MEIGNCKDFLKLTFRALALSHSLWRRANAWNVSSSGNSLPLSLCQPIVQWRQITEQAAQSPLFRLFPQICRLEQAIGALGIWQWWQRWVHTIITRVPVFYIESEINGVYFWVAFSYLWNIFRSPWTNSFNNKVTFKFNSLSIWSW